MSEEENWKDDIGEMRADEFLEAIEDESHPLHKAAKRHDAKMLEKLGPILDSMTSSWKHSPALEKLEKDFLSLEKLVQPSRDAMSKTFGLPWELDIPTAVQPKDHPLGSGLGAETEYLKNRSQWLTSLSEETSIPSLVGVTRAGQADIIKAIKDSSADAIELAKESADRGRETIEVLKILSAQNASANARLAETKVALENTRTEIADGNRRTDRTNVVMIVLATATLIVSLASLLFQLW